MLRSFAGVIAGYVVASLLIFVVFTTAYRLLGVEGSFRPGTYEVSAAWAALALLTALLAAVAAGAVCRAIARSARAVAVLAGVILLLGAVNAVLELRKPADRPRVREGTPTSQEAMVNARQPLWMLLLNPLLGLAGVLAGGRVLRKRE